MEKELSSDRAFANKKTNKSSISLLDHIRLLAIFLLILIPLLYLYYYLNELAVNNQFIKEELVKEQLLSEMNRFQEDLNPEKYIENAFHDLEKKLGIPDLNNTQYKFVFNEENEPSFLRSNFIEKAKSFLKDTYGFEPFIFVSSGYDFTDLNFYDRDNIFINPKERDEFLYSCIFTIIDDYLPESSIDFKPISDDEEKELPFK